MILLPLGGLANGILLYYGYSKASKTNTDSVIAAVHEHQGMLPSKTFLLKPIAALITLSTGGSAGREGPCVHIGGTFASWFGRLIRLSPEMRQIVVVCGVSAGFASVFGTPIAGAIYGIEVLAIGRIRHDFLFPAVIAGIASYEASKFWGLPYTYYPMEISSDFSAILFMKMMAIGILCGLAAWLFIELFEQSRAVFSFVQLRFSIWPPLVPLLGGTILSALIFVIPTDYLGLSLPIMNQALSGEDVSYLGFLWKSLFVAITLGSGSYGGIATPQFVIGALAGNAASGLLGVDPAMGAAVGMVSVVAAASNTPIAAVFMGYELFGGSIGTYVVGACITAYIVIGHRSVYPDQHVAYSKSLWMHLIPNIALEKENIRFSFGLLRRIKRWQLHYHLPWQYYQHKRPKKHNSPNI
jgi:H+/Cl- antiporter ClcA